MTIFAELMHASVSDKEVITQMCVCVCVCVCVAIPNWLPILYLVALCCTGIVNIIKNCQQLASAVSLSSVHQPSTSVWVVSGRHCQCLQDTRPEEKQAATVEDPTGSDAYLITAERSVLMQCLSDK